MDRTLEGKNAVIYGGGGKLGTGVARTFAQRGADLFLVGRRREPLDIAADAARAEGAQVETAVFDVLEEAAVTEHAERLVATAGSIDISFNLTSRMDTHGVPLVDIAITDFLQTTYVGLASNFATARAAAKLMGAQDSGGVILGLTSGSSRVGAPMMGGTGPADASIEVFLRNLAIEAGRDGVRVVGIHTAGVPETFEPSELDSNRARKESGLTPEQIDQAIGQRAALGHAPRLQQVADTAAFLASDQAGGITGTIVNVTAGLVLA